MYLGSQVNVYTIMQNLTASEYKQFNCLGTYDTLYGIEKRKRKFICREAGVKLCLIVIHMCRVKKRVSERVLPRVMHIVLQSETLGESLGERKKFRHS